jgi:hypothetical protein
VFEPPLPDSEQFRLQHSRAMETSEVLPADCAFLQQSGMLAIGQEPAPSYAPTPTALPSMAATRMKAVNHLHIVEVTILRGLIECQADAGSQWLIDDG